MRSPLILLVVSSLVLGTMDARAQAVADTAEVKNYLLYVTNKWGRESALEDLRHRAMDGDDVELRVWGGYGLGGTSGVIIRREKGQWRAWLAVVVECVKAVPSKIADTASERTIAGYHAAARKECGVDQSHTPLPANVYQVDTLTITAISTGPAIERAWKAALENGVLTLPDEWPPDVMMVDGFTYVIEVRQGTRYRASDVKELGDRDTSDVTRRVRAIYAAATGLLPQRNLNRARE
jgi:hypothetical protein